MAMTPEQEALICRVFDAYLSEHHHDDILLLLDDDGDETHHPVVVNAMTLFEANMEVRAAPTTSQKSWKTLNLHLILIAKRSQTVDFK